VCGIKINITAPHKCRFKPCVGNDGFNGLTGGISLTGARNECTLIYRGALILSMIIDIKIVHVIIDEDIFLVRNDGNTKELIIRLCLTLSEELVGRKRGESVLMDKQRGSEHGKIVGIE